MTEPTPLDDLKALRELLVAARRWRIRDFFYTRGTNKDQGVTPSIAQCGAEVRVLQEQVEAVDRAIADEERLSPD